MPVTMFSGSLPGLSPDAVAGIQLWYDANVGVYTDEAATTPATDGQSVRAWVDRYSSYKVTTQGTAAKAPTLSTTGVNGRPMFTWDATDDQLYTADGLADNYMAATGGTTFIVMKYSAANPNGNNYWCTFYDGNFVCATLDVGTPGMRSVNWDGTSDTADKNTNLDSWMVITRMYNGTNVYCGISDTRTASMTATLSGNCTFGASTNLYMRSWAGSAKLAYTAEAIHYNVALTEADRQGIETRLAWKYGITLPY